MEILLSNLKASDLKQVARDTNIPYDRMYKWLKGKGKPKSEDFKTLTDYFGHGKSSTSIAVFGVSEAKPDYNKFEGIPMFDFPAAASEIEMYRDTKNNKPVNYMHLPGASKNSFALPVLGESMFPTLKPGSWAVMRPIEHPEDIVWGEVYYIEYGDYCLYKRLLKTEDEDSVVLWSDNQQEKILDRPKYAEIQIKRSRITKLCIVTDILEKPNY